MSGPAFEAGPGDVASPDLSRIVVGCTAEEKIKRFVELAVCRCGSAAALARNLKVKPPTVSQWRAGRKRPDAIKLIQIQELAEQGRASWQEAM